MQPCVNINLIFRNLKVGVLKTSYLLYQLRLLLFLSSFRILFSVNPLHQFLDPCFTQCSGIAIKNLFPNPCSDKLVKLTFKGALRTLSKTSINKKQPITSNIISKVFSAMNNVADLSHLRTRLLFVLGFAGFFRAGELCNIRRSDITFCDTHMEIKIRCSKTDVCKGVILCILQKPTQIFVLFNVFKITLVWPVCN